MAVDMVVQVRGCFPKALHHPNSRRKGTKARPPCRSERVPIRYQLDEKNQNNFGHRFHKESVTKESEFFFSMRFDF